MQRDLSNHLLALILSFPQWLPASVAKAKAMADLGKEKDPTCATTKEPHRCEMPVGKLRRIRIEAAVA